MFDVIIMNAFWIFWLGFFLLLGVGGGVLAIISRKRRTLGKKLMLVGFGMAFLVSIFIIGELLQPKLPLYQEKDRGIP